MSSTNRGAERRPLDGYYTPLECARALVGVLDLQDVRLVVEPSIGGGAFMFAAMEACDPEDEGARGIGIDINPEASGLKFVDEPVVGDWLKIAPTLKPAPDLILGNPPFSEAEAHVRAALRAVRYGGTVAFLLRLAFLETTVRVPFWRYHLAELREVHALVERPSFTGGETDSTAYGWFVWRRGSTGEPTLKLVSWKGADVRQEGLFAR